MEIIDYINQRKEMTGKQKRLAKDFKMFDSNYIPYKPIMSAKLKPIIEALLRYEQSVISHDFIIFSSRGLEITYIFKYLKKYLAGIPAWKSNISTAGNTIHPSR